MLVRLQPQPVPEAVAEVPLPRRFSELGEEVAAEGLRPQLAGERQLQLVEGQQPQVAERLLLRRFSVLEVEEAAAAELPLRQSLVSVEVVAAAGEERRQPSQGPMLVVGLPSLLVAPGEPRQPQPASWL